MSLHDRHSLHKPRPLVRGDGVALVAPSSRYDATRLARAAGQLRDWGLVPHLPEPVEGFRYLAASDDERARRLTEAFERDDVACVMAIRGGYGMSRLLGRFEPAVAADHPKIVLGYSDLTILLSVLVNEARLVAFHGPMGASDLARLGPEELERFRRFLFNEDGWFEGGNLTALAPGRAQGRLTGGCLSVLTTTIGTPYEIETEGSVLFLEDTNEPPYRIDRLLTHLRHAGKLDGVAAVVLGKFHGCDDERVPGQVLEIAAEILGELGVPVVSGFDAGHFAGNVVLPMGCEVLVDADAGRVELLESAFAEPGNARRAAQPQAVAATSRRA